MPPAGPIPPPIPDWRRHLSNGPKLFRPAALRLYFSARHTMVVQAGHLPPGPSLETLLGLADVVLELGGHLFLSHTQIMCLEGEHFANLLGLQAEDGPCVEWRGRSLPVVPVAPQAAPPGGLSWLQEAEPHFQCLLRTIYRTSVFEVGAGAARSWFGGCQAASATCVTSLPHPSPSHHLTVILGCAPLPTDLRCCSGRASLGCCSSPTTLGRRECWPERTRGCAS
jgi:hypothetical protein